VIPEVGFPQERILAALDLRFARVECADDNGRLWFACRDPRRRA
jgi:hypothetical protein